MFPWNEHRNEGTFGCSPGTKTGTRVDSPKPPFYATALSSPSDSGRLFGTLWRKPCPPPRNTLHKFPVGCGPEREEGWVGRLLGRKFKNIACWEGGESGIVQSHYALRFGMATSITMSDGNHFLLVICSYGCSSWRWLRGPSRIVVTALRQHWWSWRLCSKGAAQ